MTKMDPAAKAKIVAALRSGEYKQGRTYLQKDGCFCVWGVVADVSGVDNWRTDRQGATMYGFDFTVPGRAVVGWTGLQDWIAARVTIDGETESIVCHNDRGVPFAKIADAIEEQL